MKPGYYIFLILLTGVSACNTKQKQTANVADSTATLSPAVTDVSPPMSDQLIRLGLTANSHWRGLNLGDDFNSVKTAEKGEPFEQDVRHVGYTVEFQNLESMDVLYSERNGKISAITTDLYLNSRPAVDAYQRELSGYFTSRYGTPKTVKGSTVWNGPTNEQVTLTDVSKGKDYGLNVSIVPGGGATASAR